MAVLRARLCHVVSCRVVFAAPDVPNRPRVVSNVTNMEVHNHESAIALRAVIGSKATRSNIAIVAVRMVRIPDFDDLVDDAPFGASLRACGVPTMALAHRPGYAHVRRCVVCVLGVQTR